MLNFSVINFFTLKIESRVPVAQLLDPRDLFLERARDGAPLRRCFLWRSEKRHGAALCCGDFTSSPAKKCFFDVKRADKHLTKNRQSESRATTSLLSLPAPRTTRALLKEKSAPTPVAWTYPAARPIATASGHDTLEKL